MSAPQVPPNVPPQQFGGPPAGQPRADPTTGRQPLPAGPTTGPQSVPPHAEPPAQPPASDRPYGFDEKGRVKRTKISGIWIGLIAAAVVLMLLIIFIGQNLDTVGLHFLGFYGEVSLGLALLVAAVLGLLIAAVPGTVRILQLRKSLRRNVDAAPKHP